MKSNKISYMKKWILNGMAICAIAAFSLTSCQKEETVDLENFVDDAVYQLQDGCGLGKLGCFELVFPVTIQFADNTTQTFASYEEMATGIKEWRKNNPTVSGKPEFVFPIDVIKSDGTTVTVESKEGLNELRKECPPRHGKGPRGHIGRGLACFELVFPVTLVLPDKTEVITNSQDELKAALKAWKEANPGKRGAHPILKFPFSVTLKKDGSSVTVSSKEDLKALKDACRD
jgi:hypothetical protein